MFRLPSEKEEHKTTIGALILSIFIIIAGIGGRYIRSMKAVSLRIPRMFERFMQPFTVVNKRKKKMIRETEKKNIK